MIGFRSCSVLVKCATVFVTRSPTVLCRTLVTIEDMGNSSTTNLRREEQEWPVVEKTVDLVMERLNPTAQQAAHVIDFKKPEEIMEILGQGLDEFTSGTSVDEFIACCQKIIDNSVKTGNSMFLNQLYRGFDAYGMAASLLSEFLNTNSHTFEVAPVFTMIERDVITKLGKLCQYGDHTEGIFTPGGSISCMYAINLARYKYDSTIKKMGLYDQPRMIIFASEQSHYAVTKGASFLGLGADSVVKVECDDKGGMSMDDLKIKVQAVSSNASSNTVPLMVWATSGTTVLNGFDNLTLIANVCQQYHMWLHVDACVGGAFLFSKIQKNLLSGIGRSDSLSWNWHKLLGAPLQTSVFLTKHEDLLSEAHGTTASYLFHEVKHYDTSFDMGNSSLQCGRKTDAVKVWLMWKARGSVEFEKIIDHAHHMAHKLFKAMVKNPRFRMVLPHAQGSTVCFWVIPPSIRKEYTNVSENSADYWRKVAPVALELKKRMVKEGCMMLQYQPLPDKQLVNFFRVTITCAPEFTDQDVDNLVGNLVRLSNDM